MLVGQTTPVEFSMKVATLAENVTVTGASPTVDTTSANVNVNLSEQLLQGTPGGRDIWALRRIQGAEPGDHASRRRRHLGRPAGHLQRARHDERAEHVSILNGINVGDPSADRRGRLLLRLRRVRRHPGVDRRARHHGADRRRLPEHGDQDRRQQVGRPQHIRVGGQDRRRSSNIDANLLKYGFPPERATGRTSSRTSTSASAAR